MDTTLSQILNHMFQSEGERARLAQQNADLTAKVKAAEAEVERLSTENESLRQEVAALHEGVKP